MGSALDTFGSLSGVPLEGLPRDDPRKLDVAHASGAPPLMGHYFPAMGETRITRRGLVGGALAGGATAALPAAEARAKPRRRSRRVDVAVVGAGFAGLTAARAIMRAGHSVVVLEARDRVGGRAHNLVLPGGEVAERGATFAGPTQDHILALAKDLGVETFPTYDTGDNVYLNQGQRQTYPSNGPTGTAPLDPLVLPEMVATVALLDQMSTSVPVDAPWTAANAVEWDGQTLESWVKSRSATERFRRIVSVATRPVFGAEPRELSLLFVLFYIAASGNEQTPGTFERNFNTAGGAQMWRFRGGTQRIAQLVARQLGRRVHRSTAVRRIDQTASGVRVECDRLVVRAKHAIVAIPPTLAARIDYHPALPAARDQLTQRLGQGTLTKVTVVYDTPFWRAAGLSGTATSADGLVAATFDDSPESGKPGILLGFVGGDNARTYEGMRPDARRAAVLDELATLFGPAARNASGYYESRWTNERYTRGCPVAIAGPGTLLAYGAALRPPAGRVHWAGTETSTYWNGYMDGAVRSGERAAAEVLAAL
jgi:monoamine oxidase